MASRKLNFSGSASTHIRWLCGGLLIGALSFAVKGVAFPQEKPVNSVIRATTRVVNVNLVVTDAQGNPIKDLAKGEIRLFDDGKPQLISFFSAVDNEQLSSWDAPVLGQDIYTNIASQVATPPSVTIVLFDMLNSRWTSQGYGLQRLRKFFRQVRPHDHIGLYLLNDDLSVLHDFHDDASALVAAIGRYDEERSHEVVKPVALKPGTAEAHLDRFLAGKENRSRLVIVGPCPRGSYCQDLRMLANESTMASLQEIGRQLTPVHGRKTLIWVTDNVPGPFLDDDLDPLLAGWHKEAGLNTPTTVTYVNGEAVERMVRLMNDAGVAVYPVSAEGLETEDLGFRNTGGAAAGPGAVEEVLSRLPDPTAHMYMDELATRTGGRAFFNRNDLETGIRRAEGDARFTYNVAYYPDHNRWKGEWRKIEVKVDRPGATVLARGGYFALPDAHALPPQARYAFLSEVAASPVDSPQLPLTVRMSTSSGQGKTAMHAVVQLDLEPLLAHQDNGHWKGDFEVVFIQLGDKKKVLDVTTKDVEADIEPGKYTAAAQAGYNLPVTLKFMLGATQLCVILRDKSSDSVGSVHIPLARYVPPTLAR